MSDLVDMLRFGAKSPAPSMSFEFGKVWKSHQELCSEAADEIERLRRVNKESHEKVMEWHNLCWDARRERDNWKDTAAQHLRNEEALASRLGKIHEIAGGCMLCSMFQKIMEGVEEVFNLSKASAVEDQRTGWEGN